MAALTNNRVDTDGSEVVVLRARHSFTNPCVGAALILLKSPGSIEYTHLS